jgi:hypothetical protein
VSRPRLQDCANWAPTFGDQYADATASHQYVLLASGPSSPRRSQLQIDLLIVRVSKVHGDMVTCLWIAWARCTRAPSRSILYVIDAANDHSYVGRGPTVGDIFVFHDLSIMDIGSIIRTVSAMESMKRPRARVWDVCDRVEEQTKKEQRRRATDRKIAAQQTMALSRCPDAG